MDVYSRIIEGIKEDAMTLPDRVWFKVRNRASGKNNAKLTPLLDINTERG